MKNLLITILVIIIVGGTLFLLQYLSILNYGFFAPKVKNIERKVFENTQSYVEGKRQELTKYIFEYKKSTPEEQEALKYIIIQTSANLDLELLDFQTRTFIESIK